MEIRNKCVKSISILLIVAIIFAWGQADFAMAALKEVSQPIRVNSFKSTDTFEKERLSVYSEDESSLKISYKTPLKADQFYVSLYRLGDNIGDLKLNIPVQALTSLASDGTTLYEFDYLFDFSQYTIPDGKYYLYIRRLTQNSITGEYEVLPNGNLYKNMETRVNGENVSILKFNDVINYNRTIKEVGKLYGIDRYLDNTLSDIDFVLRNPATRIYNTIDEQKIAYIKSVSDRVVSGALNDYDKLLKIYEYTAGNFYYDTIAFVTHSLQYANPYDNIYSFENGSTTVNASEGKVATTCQGFSAIFLALARAQGIPTRFVYGHRLNIPAQDWITEKNIHVLDHWWVEAYLDGRWIFVDPTVGTTSKHNKNKGTWVHTGVTNYTYFDPSEDQIATSHVYMNIFPDYRKAMYITNPYEIETIGNFFDIPNDSDDASSIYGTKTNGSLLNSSYVRSNLRTWGDGRLSHFMLDGNGNTEQIFWSSKGFKGNISLNNFKQLKVLGLPNNSFEVADLSDNSKLSLVHIYNNDLKNLNLSGCTKLSEVKARNNPLTNLNIYANGKNRTFEAESNGNFGFNLITKNRNGIFSLFANPDIGYKLDGVYDANDQKISYRNAFSFNPKSGTYTLKFTLDPNSFKYELNLGDSSNAKKPYITAVAKRLNALGYIDEFTLNAESFNENLSSAITKFQVVNGLLKNGIINRTTWASLFNASAKSMVLDSEYNALLTAYEETLKDKMAVAENFSTINLSASAKLNSKKIKIMLSWDIAKVLNDIIIKDNSLTNTDENTPTISSEEDMSKTENLNKLIGSIEGFEIYRSTKKYSGYTKIATTKDGTKRSFTNGKGLVKGKRYYYKVRAFSTVFGKTYYSNFSTVASAKLRSGKKSN